MAGSRFEDAVADGLAVKFGTAGPALASADQDARATLEAAFERLRRQPQLRKLAPDGAVTYSDPILAVASSWGGIAEEIGEARVDGGELVNSSIFRWALTGVRAWLNRDDKAFLDLAACVPATTISLPGDTSRIAVVGDAGYSGVPQRHVLQMIKESHARDRFDLIIHLGDTYFAGGEAEFLRHLLVPFSELNAPFYSLCGNHDLYHGPAGYMGVLKILRQPGRYFLIETPHWRIACLDTSSPAAKLLRNDGRIDSHQYSWLETLMFEDDPRELILMSHHFILSGWDEPSQDLRRQIGGLAAKHVFSWYWGHEHRCAYYDREPHGFYGASVGNGAFLETWAEPDPSLAAPAWFAREARCSCPGITPGSYWPHGYLELELGRDALLETYHVEGTPSHERRLWKQVTV